MPGSRAIRGRIRHTPQGEPEIGRCCLRFLILARPPRKFLLVGARSLHACRITACTLSVYASWTTSRWHFTQDSIPRPEGVSADGTWAFQPAPAGQRQPRDAHGAIVQHSRRRHNGGGAVSDRHPEPSVRYSAFREDEPPSALGRTPWFFCTAPVVAVFIEFAVAPFHAQTPTSRLRARARRHAS